MYLPENFQLIFLRPHTRTPPHSHTRLNFAQYDTSKNCLEKQKNSFSKKLKRDEHFLTFETDTSFFIKILFHVMKIHFHNLN